MSRTFKQSKISENQLTGSSSKIYLQHKLILHQMDKFNAINRRHLLWRVGFPTQQVFL